ncbi:hypothetical protein F4778DRAFT_160850 [Xylariomycetidae sp. FL2044]|nr:hypothetical protein F4778DRAFT_160850 [Xylariomycetidae sp. FL2044]
MDGKLACRRASQFSYWSPLRRYRHPIDVASCWLLLQEAEAELRKARLSLSCVGYLLTVASWLRMRRDGLASEPCLALRPWHAFLPSLVLLRTLQRPKLLPKASLRLISVRMDGLCLGRSRLVSHRRTGFHWLTLGQISCRSLFENLRQEMHGAAPRSPNLVTCKSSLEYTQND